MRIDRSDVVLASSHTLLDERATATSLRAWVGAEPAASRPAPAASLALSPEALQAWASRLTSAGGSAAATASGGSFGALVAMAASRGRPSGASGTVSSGRTAASSPAALSAAAASAASAVATSSTSAVSGDLGTPEATDDPKLQLLLLIVERLTGRRVRLLKASDVQPDRCAAQQKASTAAQAEIAARSGGASGQTQAPVGWGVEFDAHTVRREAESTAVAASGTVVTDDGREIRFQLDVAMERTFESREDVSVRLGDAARLKDPLVVNLDGNAVHLTSDTVEFDIDVDGSAETIAFVAPGSAFLALDRDTDGTIDDGSELFGAGSGDGFAELAAFDADGNGWIDEGDAVYGTLRLWSRDAAGAESLVGLADAGVGAIYLGSAASPFQLRDTANQLDGAVRATGVYLREDARGGVTAGSIQQIDLVA